MRLTKYDKPMTAALSQPEPLPGGKSRPSILGNADYPADFEGKWLPDICAERYLIRIDGGGVESFQEEQAREVEHG
ncbi:MAG TPA: hypothetical protein DCQ42_14875 [Halomonas sp.]|nr:hypothetical protein [uncultured Halomonas sp.]HAO02957.1 hypothetical protein [Halomonas sp.]